MMMKISFFTFGAFQIFIFGISVICPWPFLKDTHNHGFFYLVYALYTKSSKIFQASLVSIWKVSSSEDATWPMSHTKLNQISKKTRKINPLAYVCVWLKIHAKSFCLSLFTDIFLCKVGANLKLSMDDAENKVIVISNNLMNTSLIHDSINVTLAREKGRKLRLFKRTFSLNVPDPPSSGKH